MAKSYKRYPIVRQERVDKKWWNKALRNKKLDYSLKGAQYKKVMVNFETWHFRWTLDDAIELAVEMDKPVDEAVEYWKRCCYRK
ncbi:hypothetical protein [Acetivibrio ethanolgignens]|uniref:Uncharacterized protein n=1 Tax=Acetivibrio ethanolgignens TaxID=290052 RepID=A0A0V8QFA2_9FIRM|nr:hypothetical protein [Acetivibrio ethanolgignens]KSV59146.1 hypothetical protein ASU35_10325 [Acetivibrio ethanolgignens]